MPERTLPCLPVKGWDAKMNQLQIRMRLDMALPLVSASTFRPVHLLSSSSVPSKNVLHMLIRILR